MSHDPLMKAHACPIHSTWFQFVDHQVFNGRCYSTVERSLQGSNLVLPLPGCVTLGKLLTSLCPSKTEVAVVLTAAAAKALQSCPTLCDPVDWSLPGSSVHGVFQYWTGVSLPSPVVLTTSEIIYMEGGEQLWHLVSLCLLASTVLAFLLFRSGRAFCLHFQMRMLRLGVRFRVFEAQLKPSLSAVT